MKENIKTISQLIVLSLVLIFTNCEKEDQQNLVEQSKEQFNAANLEAAKEFYNQNHTNTASTSRTTETTSVQIGTDQHLKIINKPKTYL